MKKVKIKKMLLALTMVGLASTGNAQWAVSNVNDSVYFGPVGIFTQLMGQMLNSVKSSVDQVATLSEINRKQALQLQQDTDARNRIAMGQAAIAAKNADIFPTLQACAEITKQTTGSGAIASASYGGSSGGRGRAPSGPAAAATITSEATKQVNLIKDKKDLGTCSTTDAANSIAGCTGLGEFGGSAKIASSDLSPLSLKGNTKRSDKVNPEDQELANFTLDPEGMDVALKYINNATLYNAPKVLPQEKAKENPAYETLYSGVMIKLYGAQQALKDIVSSRKAPRALADQSLAQAYWDGNKAKYSSIFGMKAPELPSLSDIMNFNAANDYMGVPDDTAKSQEELIKELNKKIALNNMIAVKQLSQQENTNILLSLLLTQSVTPTDVNAINNQYGRIMNNVTTGSKPAAK